MRPGAVLSRAEKFVSSACVSKMRSVACRKRLAPLRMQEGAVVRRLIVV